MKKQEINVAKNSSDKILQSSDRNNAKFTRHKTGNKCNWFVIVKIFYFYEYRYTVSLTQSSNALGHKHQFQVNCITIQQFVHVNESNETNAEITVDNENMTTTHTHTRSAELTMTLSSSGRSAFVAWVNIVQLTHSCTRHGGHSREHTRDACSLQHKIHYHNYGIFNKTTTFYNNKNMLCLQHFIIISSITKHLNKSVL